MMKKTLSAALLTLALTFGVSFAGNIAVEPLNAPYGQCNPAESKDINYYLQGQFSQKPADSFYNTHSYGTIPRRASNAVQLWSNGVIGSCQDWGLESNFFPASNANNKYVIFQNHDACSFSIPNYTKETNPDRLDAQIHYKIAYSYVMPNGDKSATLPWYYRKNGENVYRCAENNQITNQTSTCPQSEKKYDSKIYQHLGECLNYRVFWCGDGLLNGQQGNTDYENGTFTEQCDPKDPNKTNWGNWGCSAECKPVNTITPQPIGPKCNSQYNGQTLENLTPGAHLCTIGTYANFQFNPTTLTWTWTCNGVVGTTPAQCSAKKKPGIDPQPITPACNSTYAGQTHYNQNYPVAWLNAGMQLCKPGTVFAFQGPNDKGYYQRGCKLLWITTEGNACQAREQWCGDGVVQAQYEECDPNAPLQVSGKVCSKACKLEDKPIYDLALTKTLATLSAVLQSGAHVQIPAYKPGDAVKFKITVYNQGTLPAKDIQVTEYIPRGLLLNDTNWQQQGTFATRWIRDTILPGKKIELWLMMKIDPNFTGGKILNFAEISADNSSSYGTSDQDSTPNQNVDDDCIVGETNHYINGNGLAGGPCTPATDEDDHDVVPLLVVPETPGVPPYIEKELNGDPTHLYQVGELVGFKMPFGNTGSKTIYNVKIRDFLPLNLEYVSSEIHGVKPYTSGLYMNGGVQVLEYSGFNLAPGQQGYLLMTGRVLSGNTNSTLNRVGIYENDHLWDWDDAVYHLGKKKLKIEKTVDKPIVMSGEIVEFTIEVSNLDGVFTNLTLRDTLPKGLKYVPNTWYLTGQTTDTQVIDFQHDAYSAWKLEQLTWRLRFPKGFKKSDFFLIKFKAQLTENIQDHYTNVACVSVPWEPIEECDPEDVKPLLKNPELKIKKYVSRDLKETDKNDTSLQFSAGATAYFSLEVGNATAPFKNFRVEDQIPDNLEYLDSMDLPDNAFTGVMYFTGGTLRLKPEYRVKVSLSNTGTNPKITWNVVFTQGEFIPWDRFVVKFKAKVKTAGTNTAHLYYPIPWGEGHDEDPAAVTLPGGWGGWGGWGWGSSWGRGGWGGSSYCGDGKQNGAEFCDWGAEYTIPENGQLFKHEPSNTNPAYAGYTCTSQCTLKKDDQLPACFNTQNGSISIMKGEMLPFYWNIEGLLGKRSEKEKTDYIKNSFFLSKTDNTCESKDLWKIDLRTMQCTFAVYGPGKGNSLVVSAFKTDCINVDGWSKANGEIYPAIKSFISQNQNGWFGGSELNHQGQTHNVFDTLDNWEYPTLLPLSSKLIISNFGTASARLIGKGTQSLSSRDIQTFGEYKLSLEKIEYQTCVSSTDDKGNAVYKLSTQKDGYDRVCEVDFAVTDPYMIQKSPYGIGNKSTTDLSKYQLKNGTNFMSQFFEQATISDTAYETPKNMKTLFINFKNKYAKLAKTVKGAIKKVPGKSIYLISGKSIDLKSVIGNSTKPFTLIATDPNAEIIIKGNLSTNAMIMTQGTIVFDAEGACNGQAGYGKAGQMVQGIFYAGNGFVSENDKKNNDLNNSEWCNYGNLHIKGVAIGDLSKVMRERRSELYTWFNASSSSSTKKKSDIVVNGASVLVEYNPSLRGNLPPGAEEFNKALEVYRK